MKSNVTIMPLEEFLNSRLRQQQSRIHNIENYLNSAAGAGPSHYSAADIDAIRLDIALVKKCIAALTAKLIIQ